MIQHTQCWCAQFMESPVIRLRGPLRLPCTCYVMLLRVEWEPLLFVLPEVVIKRLAALSPQLPKPHAFFFCLQIVLGLWQHVGWWVSGGDLVPPLQVISDVWKLYLAPKLQYPHTSPHSVTKQKTVIKIFFLAFLVWPLLPTKCRCRVLLL
jgi:hypothetical protein